MSGRFKVQIGEGSKSSFSGEPLKEGGLWSGPKLLSKTDQVFENGIIPETFIQEKIMEVIIPQKWSGKQATLLCELNCDTTDEKWGWHFEGFAVVFNTFTRNGMHFPHSINF